MNAITIRHARHKATAQLQQAGIESAALDARVLLAHVLRVSGTGLLMRDPEPIGVGDAQRFQALVHQRATGVPVAYLVGEREFMGLAFRATDDVLVPRPDTEPLVEWGLAWLHEHPHAMVADIGTGSGAIAIAITEHASDIWTGHTIATDISEPALTIARANADALLSPERRSRLYLAHGDLTAPLIGPIDLLLANLPYLTSEQISENKDLVHEPEVALDGGMDGLDLIRRVIGDLPRVLAPGGAAGFEIDPSQSGAVQQLLHRALPGHRVQVLHDLAGDERHVIAF